MLCVLQILEALRGKCYEGENFEAHMKGQDVYL